MIPVYKPQIGNKEKEYVNDCLESTWISSKGQYIEEFEKRFADYIGAPYATSVCNGTVAIHLALVALDIGPGDEVIVPTFTYVASVNTIVHAGATPVFVDSLETTWQIDPEDIERKITKHTKAIMVVHLYGYPCNMDVISEIAKKHNLYIIEDCAEAFGTRFKNQHVGTFGDISTFSFFANKTITTGEGGMVVSKHKKIMDIAAHLKSQGVSKEREYWHDKVAYNYRMTNICAAIGLAQLEQADTFIEKKRKIAQLYKDQLADLPLRVHFSDSSIETHSYWMCSILLDDEGCRQPLRDYLKEHNIETRPLFYPAHTLPPYSKDKLSFPVAESLGKRGINLPSYPQLSSEEIEYICTQIKAYFANLQIDGMQRRSYG